MTVIAGSASERERSNADPGVAPPTIVRHGHLAEKIVFVDGQPGCGKTMLSPIIAALDRVELMTYAFEIEFVCRLHKLGKVERDAAVALVRMFTDHKLNQLMMGRETNFRFKDLSSVFQDASPWRYFRRIFQEGDRAIPERIIKERPILNLTTHDLLAVGEPIFAGLGDRAVVIEVVRHPLYMIKQQEINMASLHGKPRDIQVNIEHDGKELPYFAHGWEELYARSNPIEKAIHSIDRLTRATKESKRVLLEKYNAQIVTVPFERYVLDPWPYMKTIQEKLGTVVTPKTIRVMKTQKVPRKMIADGINLAVYRRYAWEPAARGSNEKAELEKRRSYAVQQGASKSAMDLLDSLGEAYEASYLAGDNHLESGKGLT